VVVISDLHLGGPEGFQMCTPEGVHRLAAFLASLGDDGATASQIHLVIAGDFVDFLAEPDDEEMPRESWKWSAFCEDEALALRKLERIFERTVPVWWELERFLACRGALSILLGNHDVELSMPRVRRRLLERIAPNGGRISFLDDGEAFVIGKLLVEHGNRYDAWNAVEQEALRARRAALSRNEAVTAFPAQPGSALVAEVMNRIKAKYSFVDLLKPETGAVVPILAVLDPALWRRTGPGIGEAARAAWRARQFDTQGKPTRTEFIGVEGPARRAPAGSEFLGAPLFEPSRESDPSADASLLADRATPFPDDDLLALADELSRGTAETTRELVAVPGLAVDLLLRAFRKRRGKERAAFAVDVESETYLRPARALAARGFDVVVFGHTHHAKCVDLGDGRTYLNTGTWADLMRLPEAIYDEREGPAALQAFMDAVSKNRVELFRRQIPTYARIVVDDSGEVVERGLYFADEPGASAEVSTHGMLKRLEGNAQSAV
jgi:UDP-2,3-diacylglucosamine pyrophosphatase LpxH